MCDIFAPYLVGIRSAKPTFAGSQKIGKEGSEPPGGGAENYAVSGLPECQLPTSRHSWFALAEKVCNPPLLSKCTWCSIVHNGPLLSFSALAGDQTRAHVCRQNLSRNTITPALTRTCSLLGVRYYDTVQSIEGVLHVRSVQSRSQPQTGRQSPGLVCPMAKPRSRKYVGNTYTDETGKFTAGNPGKPKGARHKVTRAVETLLEGQSEALTQKAIELALEGDTPALRLCMERIAPPRKDSPVSFNLPAIKSAVQASEAAQAILCAVSEGEITPLEGAAVMTLVEQYRRTLETTELEQRITALEGDR